MARPQNPVGDHSNGVQYAETLTLSADIVFTNDRGQAVPARAIFVGTGGNLKVRMASDGTEHLYKNVQSGDRLVGRFSAVIYTLTTAADLIAEW